MKRLKTPLFVCIILCLAGCHGNESPIIQSEFQFIPAKYDKMPLEYRFHPLITSSTLMLPILAEYYPFTGKFDFNQILTMDLESNKVDISQNDFLRIGDFLPLSEDVFIATDADLSKLLKLNRQKKVVQSIPFSYTVRDMLSMGNGHYVITAEDANNKESMFCYNSDLQLQWQKPLTLPPSFDAISNSICRSGNYIYVMYNNLSSFFYRVSQYDLNGNFIRYIDSEFNRYAGRIVESKDGFIVFSIMANVSKENELSVAAYNWDCNLVNENILNIYPKFTSAIETNFNASNIVKQDNAYYLTARSGTETMLLKINDHQELEWAKSIDKKRGLFRRYELLFSDGKHIVNFGNTLWAGMEGLSIIKTNMNGEIVK